MTFEEAKKALVESLSTLMKVYVGKETDNLRVKFAELEKAQGRTEIAAIPLEGILRTIKSQIKASKQLGEMQADTATRLSQAIERVEKNISNVAHSQAPIGKQDSELRDREEIMAEYSAPPTPNEVIRQVLKVMKSMDQLARVTSHSSAQFQKPRSSEELQKEAAKKDFAKLVTYFEQDYLGGAKLSDAKFENVTMLTYREDFVEMIHAAQKAQNILGSAGFIDPDEHGKLFTSAEVNLLDKTLIEKSLGEIKPRPFSGTSEDA